MCRTSSVRFLLSEGWLEFQFLPGQHVHILGIGGFGMSAIARILLKTGYRISGSDEQVNALTKNLESDGAIIYIGHQAEHVIGADVVLVSSAIPEKNPEIQAAYVHHIPVLRRREAIGALTANYRTLAVAGTHGKTTTTALLSHVLTIAGLDPTTIVGGVINSLGTNARIGQGKFFVIEADEYGEMFLGLTPEIAIITNIEFDHPDQFSTLEAMIDIFQHFVSRVTGVLVAGIDSPPVAKIAATCQLPTLTYSLVHQGATWLATDITSTIAGTIQFTVRDWGTVTLQLLGKHNVQNALAVIAVAHHLGVEFPVIVEGLASFSGTKRRSDIMGQIAGVTVVNDYAHHPTAIRTMLEAWKSQAKQLWAVWQPHTYSRLRSLAAEFAHAFTDADHVLVTDVYSVREEITPGLAAPNLADMIRATGHLDSCYSGSFDETADLLATQVAAGDVVIIMSAGDAPQIGDLLLEKLQQRES